MTTTQPEDWDPLAPEAVEDPISVYERLRSECPVARTSQFGGVWGVTTYADIERVAHDTETFTSAQGTSIPRIQLPLPLVPLESDPPRHFDYRSTLQPYFARGRVRRLEPEIRTVAGELLASLLDAEAPDFAKQFAQPFPAAVLCLFLGVDPEDRSRILDLSHDIVNRAVLPQETVGAAIQGLIGYIRELMESRRAAPRPVETDIMSGMLAATFEDRPLTDDEIVGAFFLMLIAGHETATGGLANSVLYLAEHPDQQQQLRSDPDAVPTAIEELLRYQAPVQHLGRVVTAETELGGRTLHEGDSVALLWISGNRDGSKFPDADRCVLDRRPNRHLAFGSGVHRCLGVDLARLEMRVAIEELLARTEGFEVSGPVERTQWPTFGLRSLPLRVTR